jgi:uncharacterized protein YggE
MATDQTAGGGSSSERRWQAVQRRGRLRRPADMAKINGWQAVAVAVGLAGLGVGFLWGHDGAATTGAAAIAPAAAYSTAGGGAGVVGNGISVTGSGTVSGTPDALKLAMGVQVTRPTVTAALDEANAAASRVQAALKAKGVAEKDLQTSGVSIQAQYSYSDNKQTLTGYQVGENLTATLRDLKTAGATISAAAEAGGDATRVDSVSLDLTDTGDLVTKARAAAFTQAKDKASQYAKVAGVDLGDVVSIQESVATPPVAADMPYAAPAATAKGVSPVPIASGSQDVVVTVSVVFAIG